jgi:hypothetical protein
MPDEFGIVAKRIFSTKNLQTLALEESQEPGDEITKYL